MMARHCEGAPTPMHRLQLHAEATRPERMRWQSRRAAPLLGTGLAFLTLAATGWPADLAFAMTHWYPNNRIALIEYMQEKDLSEKEIEFLKDVLKEKYEIAMWKLGTKRLWESALSMYEDMKATTYRDGQTDTMVFETLHAAATTTRRGCSSAPLDAREGIWAQALQHMADITARDKQTVDAYQACMKILEASSYGRKEPMEKIFDLFNDMRERGINATEQIYTHQLQACEALGQWQHALKILRDCQDNLLVPEQAAYNRVIKLLEEAEKEDLYIKVLQEMVDYGYDLDV